MSTERPRRLGRGLEALFGNQAAAVALEQAARDEVVLASALRQIPVTDIVPNRLQPRKEFDPTELQNLEASIKANGLLQPITVRAAANGFELIAGERRFRAVQRLGWDSVPAIVKDDSDVSDKALLTLALVENLQRSDLNPIEEAEGYQNLVTQFQLTQQDIATVVGKDRSTVANTLRLLALPLSVRRMVREGALSLGHARALLSLGDDTRMTDLAKETVAKGLNVRDVERRVRELGAARPSTGRKKEVRVGVARSPEVGRIEGELRRRLQTDVSVHLTAPEKGEVRIAFYSADDLERVLDIILGTTREML
jgi:ParB family chromosome partitioning protein